MLEKQLQLPGKLNMEHEGIALEEVNNLYTSKLSGSILLFVGVLSTRHRKMHLKRDCIPTL